ncbi:MAG TPA: thioredoxin-dependent thiol peroxidase [Phycisphaerales bacterium]|nr:thioredoxin-dependent thiol peroxidase [Phycisphaerales bacterium]HRQ75217.1 thioredoxin-dependent thiol peroxidase [Phycisphaerales bacterium]
MPIIEAGKIAPQFSLRDQTGRLRTLNEFQGKPLVLYFYPKDDTPGCTTQACQFRDAMPRFEASGVTVVGVSPDDVASHTDFTAKFTLNFTLLADVPDSSGVPPVCDAYGVWREKNMYGRKYMGVVRTTYLIDAAGRVTHRWDNVKVPGHEEQVLKALQHNAQSR